MSEDACISSQGHLESVLIETTIESWRFAAVFDRAIRSTDMPGMPRYVAKATYFRERLRTCLRDAGFNIVEHEPGASYDPGLAVTPVNLGDFDEDDILVIDQVLEPTIMGPNGIQRMGTVMLRKVD